MSSIFWTVSYPCCWSTSPSNMLSRCLCLDQSHLLRSLARHASVFSSHCLPMSVVIHCSSEQLGLSSFSFRGSCSDPQSTLGSASYFLIQHFSSGEVLPYCIKTSPFPFSSLSCDRCCLDNSPSKLIAALFLLLCFCCASNLFVLLASSSGKRTIKILIYFFNSKLS